MDINQSLKALGLEAKEIRVYKALLEQGIASPKAVSHRAEVKRSTTYVVLEELEKKGFVFEVPQESKKRYRARPPKVIFAEREEMLEKAKKSLPALEALLEAGDTKPHVLFFEGKDGIERIMEHGLEAVAGKELKTLMCTMSSETVEKFNNFKSYNKKLKDLDITSKSISPTDPDLPAIAEHRKQDAEYGRDVIELPLEKFNSQVSIEISNKWVKMYDFENLQGLIIENKAIANTLEQMFGLLWNNLRT